MLTVAMKAAEAIDEASLVAAGGSLRRIDDMCEAIAEAIYLDNAFRGCGRAAALDAVFRELDWQRRHLRALSYVSFVRSFVHLGGSATISTFRHISLRVPQPGSTGAVSDRVSYSHVT
jgi:hypothetical protein